MSDETKGFCMFLFFASVVIVNAIWASHWYWVRELELDAKFVAAGYTRQLETKAGWIKPRSKDSK